MIIRRIRDEIMKETVVETTRIIIFWTKGSFFMIFSFLRRRGFLLSSSD